MFATESCHEMWIRIYGYIKCGCPVRLYETVSQDSWIFNPELQYRAALKQLKQERIKKYEYCLPCESCFNSQFHHHCSRWVMTNCPSPLDLYIILFFDVMSIFCRSNLWTLTYADTFAVNLVAETHLEFSIHYVFSVVYWLAVLAVQRRNYRTLNLDFCCGVSQIFTHLWRRMRQLMRLWWTSCIQWRMMPSLQ